ncbi:methyltransferase domain-containing protein [Mycobacterium sp. M1]|uniref:Methyltransferase domain-containing protein n=1 Tax=Mycolicibacter acidiphilus TaxID=2835306 RepID=A0ABS5RG74_9MYCO|nr:class I SAM-dependent methyltransferase [Mycolicibacter acidiphilus]MBS9532644.1 methyltransferase domain-containing protein [Mycolicibacter acidiphilus]
MTDDDRAHWDERYVGRGAPEPDAVAPATVFLPHVRAFPTAGSAVDIACGPGTAAVWLARRGMQVTGFDVSPVAVAQARELAERSGVGDRCRFTVVDLDDGLPDGPPVDVVYCARFRDTRLYRPMADRLAAGGLLAVTVLSRVGGPNGSFRAAPGELRSAFADLELIAEGEGEGEAWLLGVRKPG